MFGLPQKLLLKENLSLRMLFINRHIQETSQCCTTKNGTVTCISFVNLYVLYELNFQPQRESSTYISNDNSSQILQYEVTTVQKSNDYREMGNCPSCEKYVPLCKHAEPRQRYSKDIEWFRTSLTFSKEYTLLRLTEDPFPLDAELPINLQSLPEFYSGLDVTKVKHLRDSALKVCCVREQKFSIMNVNKNRKRSSLSGEYLEDILKISIRIMVRACEKVNAERVCNVPH